MKKLLLVSILAAAFSAPGPLPVADHHGWAACKTTGTCTACKNCRYCKPCAKGGKTCSVCR